ncbi:MAG: lipid-binding SYLF domain-containing protein [Candidatus Binatia bacterium]
MNAFQSRIALTVTILALALSAPAARGDEDLQELVNDARDTITRFTADPNMDWFRDNAEAANGLLVVPRLWRGGFFFGGSGGSGVLLARHLETGTWSYPAFYTIGSVSVGPQIGAEQAEVVLMIMTQRGLDSMLATSVKLGADISVAAGPVGTGAKAATADILAFSRSKGLYGGVTVEGAVIAARHSWNEAYYRRPVRPLDILFERTARNPSADPLREAVTRVAGIVRSEPGQPTATLRRSPAASAPRGQMSY